MGGILANQRRPATFLYDNLMIEANLNEAARTVGVRKLLLLGSSCIYPSFAPQPIKEGALLTSLLEPTNEDRRRKAVPVLPTAIWLRLHFGDAEQFVRAER